MSARVPVFGSPTKAVTVLTDAEVRRAIRESSSGAASSSATKPATKPISGVSQGAPALVIEKFAAEPAPQGGNTMLSAIPSYPVAVGSLRLFMNGCLQYAGDDFFFDGQRVTWVSPDFGLDATDELQFVYFKQ